MQEFYLFESLFFDCYFPTLVYKFAVKLLQKDKLYTGQLYRIVNISYACYICLVVSIFIYRNV